MKKKIIDTILLICIAFFTAIPLFYLLKHPEITMGQLLVKFWKEYLLAANCIIGYLIGNIKRT